MRHFVRRSARREGSSEDATGGENAGKEEEGNEEEEEEEEDAGVKELWERVSDEELEKDPCVRVMREETEEGKKVARHNGNKYVAVFRRLPDPEWPAAGAGAAVGA